MSIASSESSKVGEPLRPPFTADSSPVAIPIPTPNDSSLSIIALIASVSALPATAASSTTGSSSSEEEEGEEPGGGLAEKRECFLMRDIRSRHME